MLHRVHRVHAIHSPPRTNIRRSPCISIMRRATTRESRLNRRTDLGTRMSHRRSSNFGQSVRTFIPSFVVRPPPHASPSLRRQTLRPDEHRRHHARCVADHARRREKGKLAGQEERKGRFHTSLAQPQARKHSIRTPTHSLTLGFANRDRGGQGNNLIR